MNDLEDQLQTIINTTPFITRNVGRLFQNIANTEIIVQVTGGAVNDANKEPRVTYTLSGQTHSLHGATLISTVTAFKNGYNRINEVKTIQADPDTIVD